MVLILNISNYIICKQTKKNCAVLTVRNILVFTEVIWAVWFAALRATAPSAVDHRYYNIKKNTT